MVEPDEAVDSMDEDDDAIEYNYEEDTDSDEDQDHEPMAVEGKNGGRSTAAAGDKSSTSRLSSSSSGRGSTGRSSSGVAEMEDEEVIMRGGTAAGGRRVSTDSNGAVKRRQYTILTMKDLENKQARLIDDLSDRLSVGPLPAKLLLRRYGWNVRSVCDDHFDDAMDMIEALAKGKKAKGGRKKAGQSSGVATFKCGVCWDACPVTVRMALPGCGHAFCRECLEGYFKARIEEGAAKLLSCMHPDCHELYPEEMVLDVVDEQYGQRYSKQNVEYFVSENPSIKFCPGPDCKLAAEIRDAAATAPPTSILCDCGHRWCFSCKEPPHLPLPCKFQQQWKERTADDGEMATVEYLKLSCKICPWCKDGVNKLEGTCNYMTCRCGENFCYKCGGKVKRGAGHTWNTIEQHECGRLAAVDSRKAGDIGRFIHYLSNFKAQRLMDETKRREEGAERDELEDIMLVNRSRTLLANSYVFAYYAFEEGSALASRLTLFEDKQQMLERQVEVMCKMMSEREKYPETHEKYPSDQDLKSQRDLVRHWLLALYGTIEKDILEDDAYGISIPEYQPEDVVYKA